jgi:hypothetical protein
MRGKGISGSRQGKGLMPRWVQKPDPDRSTRLHAGIPVSSFSSDRMMPHSIRGDDKWFGSSWRTL